MLRFWDHHGILGINARNLLYIKPLNKKAQISFADDKMRTKQYLSARGINTGRLLGKITSEAELLKFPWESLSSDFVLKPNAGYGGEGIIVVTGKEDGGWVTIKGDVLTQDDMVEHVADTLDGRYSITGSNDMVFFEQRLVCHPDMKALGRFGLPDIRVIVFNLVPVMAMVRVPTRESHGKANIHVGGLGLGVDLSKGEITHMAHYNKIIKEHPDFGSLKGVKIPFWEEVLLLATQIQQLITLGYLAVDIVIDEELGPTLLEINARAGLAVQVANLAPLRDRLDRVAGVKVQSPEKGVRMAQDLFGNKIERSIQAISGKKVIGMTEEITLNLKQGTTTITGRMNPTMNKNYLEEGLFRKIAGDDKAESLTLGYTLMGERGKTLFYPLEMSDDSYKVILGKKALSNFFLDVSRSSEQKKIPSISSEDQSKSAEIDFDEIRARSEREYWQQVDHRLAELDKELSLVSQIRPLNLEEEKTRFLSSPNAADPQFRYKPAPEKLIEVIFALRSLHLDLNVPMGRLLDEKRRELLLKANLISVIGDDDHFVRKSELFFGTPPDEVIQKAQKALKKLPKHREPQRRITAEKAAEKMQQFLKEKGLLNWQVKVKEGIVSRCVIGKHNRLLVKKGERFSQWDVDKLIAHEIETHIYCTENGKRQPYELFRRGSAHYLKTQEGLAVYHQNQVVDHGLRDSLISFNAAIWAKEMGFRDLFNKLLDSTDQEQAWKASVKVKRGLADTSIPGAFGKNLLYYWGYVEIEDHLKQGGDLKELFLGKFHLPQLEEIHQIEGIVPPHHLPDILVDS